MQTSAFSWLDYFLFILTLTISALVGVYFGFFQKQNTPTEYLLGGKQMGVWPISMSLVSSALSGFTLLSVPADIYRYGITFGLTVPGLIVVGLASYHLFLPVFYKLQITSVYEFFNIRFNYKVRVFASFLFAINMMLFLPIVIYIPALALAQVTTISVHTITPIVCGICIFYTTLGGLKAVVWTDTIQFVVMLGSLIVVLATGIWRGGGLNIILKNSYAGGRLNISFDFDLLKRDTFWALVIGQNLQMISYFSISQGSVQKFLSLPSFKTIKRALIFSTIGMIIISGLSIFSGLVMFSKYFNCDPLKLNAIKNYDQLLPYFVVEEVGFLTGLPGLFISGIFSAGLSTLSAILNCLAATIYEDFISPFIPKETSQKKISQYLKLIVVIIGVISTSLVYAVEKLGSLVALTLSFAGITSGPLLGLFCVGMLFPSINAKGALLGGMTSLAAMTWIIMVSQWYKINGIISYPILPVSTDDCNKTVLDTINKTLTEVAHTITSFTPNTTETEKPLFLYRMSFYWYNATGVLITLVTASITSYLTKPEKPLNKDCITPLMHFLIKEKDKQPPSYNDVALEKLNK